MAAKQKTKPAPAKDAELKRTSSAEHAPPLPTSIVPASVGLKLLVFVAGAVLMVSWDLSLDPGASTIGKAWIWIDAGAFFGVPLQNFFGWYLTVFLFLALFAWYQAPRPVREGKSRNFWAQPIVMYFFLALRYPLIYVRATDSGEVTDSGGHIRNASDIRPTAALLAVFTMMAFALIVWLRLYHRTKDGGVASV